MTEQTHTPGPVVGDLVYAHGHRLSADIPETNIAVVPVYWDETITLEVRAERPHYAESLATLGQRAVALAGQLAAAPDLLAACKAVVEEWNSTKGESCYCAMKQAQAAIAKAEGR